MSDIRSFRGLSVADRWSMAGHLLTALATVAFSVATLWRTLEEGQRLPDGKLPDRPERRSAQDYFS